jgi:hypothetical protein
VQTGDRSEHRGPFSGQVVVLVAPLAGIAACGAAARFCAVQARLFREVGFDWAFVACVAGVVLSLAFAAVCVEHGVSMARRWPLRVVVSSDEIVVRFLCRTIRQRVDEVRLVRFFMFPRGPRQGEVGIVQVWSVGVQKSRIWLVHPMFGDQFAELAARIREVVPAEKQEQYDPTSDPEVPGATRGRASRWWRGQRT